jgi:putative redox protein
MVEIKITYEGQLRCKAVHKPSGQVILTDAPTDNMGKGEFFSPTDLVAAALGTCMLTIMGIAANKYKIDVGGATADVVKQMSNVPARQIGTLRVTINVPKALTKEQKLILENAAKGCPVHKSLSHSINIPIEFVYANSTNEL